ncbi:DNA-directed RNA polymerase specialized sigma subunit, sigma24 family [Brevibacterium sandarakinum]|uniref:DNA-directed RNA polymerase specialized sigma subunit, sigma24 family n=1 Tax=Brevibacterium sandarakinum TaxID=629680 RepID=A0A1H1SG34_BRESA|nr:hypothetical protein [Brevibacterium sandarakinum]SDS46964.1 DNA-directed RNA polymerase specialized sigma subunit, sigma24 family [Brevibacterium sandarakinum]
MDAQAHKPGEELADFTENELLSLIDAGTAGAYSEIYRRYIDDAVARASSSLPDADARAVADDAFLSVLRSLLNGTADTAEGLQSKVNNAIDERLAVRQPRADSSLQGAPASDQGQASAQDGVDPNHALLAQAMSTLPDNWQRILWLREVEQLPTEAVADRLNIRTTVVERLSSRAHQDLQKEWDKVRPEGSDAAADRRSALVPAFLTSPIVIERLADVVAHTPPEPAGFPVAGTASAAAAPAVGAAVAGAAAPETESAPEASSAPETSPQPDADTAAEATGAAVFADADSNNESPESAEGAEPAEDTEPAGDAESSRTASLAAVSASADPAHIPAQTSIAASSRSGFSMPKPVLIPVIAACIGLLGTLVGLAIVPHQEESLRSGGGTSNVSKVDTSSEDEDSSRDEQSPDDTDSRKGSREQGSENSQASVPGASDQDEDEKSSPSSQDDAGRTGEDSPSKDTSDDNGDSPSSRNPDDPGPSDSDRPDADSPSDPTPSESESPSDEPSEPDEPAPTTDPEPEPDPTPTTEPEPDPEPTPTDPPPETDEPESPPATDSPEPGPSETGTDSEPTSDEPTT